MFLGSGSVVVDALFIVTSIVCVCSVFCSCFVMQCLRSFLVLQHLGGEERAGPEVNKLFLYSPQMSTKFILLINVKMPTIVNILTFISTINTAPGRLRARNFFICRYFRFNEHLIFHAQLS